MPDILKDLLKQTSRTFYLTLRVLPGAVRPQIGLAYLLARTSDTIADTEIVPLEQRLKALQAFRERMLGIHKTPLDFGNLARRQGSTAEQMLLEKCEISLSSLRTLPPADLQLVLEVLETITHGQELDLSRFADATAEQVVALRTATDLDDYTYRVAGCVGQFWTRICRAHVFPKAKLDDAKLLADGIRFGQGLQLVNILRDLPADLRKGRCYLPAEGLAALGLLPGDLLSPANEPKLRPFYSEWLDRAEAHLAAGWAYTNALPWRFVRVRLACAWPILIGVKTLARLRAGNVLDPQRSIKVSRAEVRRIILRSVGYYPWPAAWRNLFVSPRH